MCEYNPQPYEDSRVEYYDALGKFVHRPTKDNGSEDEEDNEQQTVCMECWTCENRDYIENMIYDAETDHWFCDEDCKEKSENE